MTGEDSRGTATVSTGHNRDGEVRESDSGIVLGNRGIIPIFDVTHENADVGSAGELQAALHSGNIVGENDRSGGCGNQDNVMLGLGDFLILHGNIATTEIGDTGGELLDTSATAVALIIDGRVRVCFVEVGGPTEIEGGREGCSGTTDGGCGRHVEGSRGGKRDGCKGGTIHGFFMGLCFVCVEELVQLATSDEWGAPSATTGFL